jgi:hypothetical protein
MSKIILSSLVILALLIAQANCGPLVGALAYAACQSACATGAAVGAGATAGEEI